MSNVLKLCFPSRSRKCQKAKFSARCSIMQTARTCAEDPNMVVWNEQFSAGDQADSTRLAFWNSSFAACYNCGSFDLERLEERAGIRMNGESYGTERFICTMPGCGWETSFQFDDASEACWHYEAIGWPRCVMYYPVKYMLLWARKHSLPATVRKDIREKKITGEKMIQMARDGELEESLNIDKKMAEKIKKILHDKWGAILK